jgi:TPR repeat protein
MLHLHIFPNSMPVICICWQLHEKRGKGVEIDLSLAARCYKLSADQGHARGQFNYGVCLEFGKGVEIDLGLAALCYKLSADQGNSNGQYKYGRRLEKSIGVSADSQLSR